MRSASRSISWRPRVGDNRAEGIPAALAWLDRARVEAYLRGDIWFVLFYEDGSRENRIKVSVDAVTGVAQGAAAGGKRVDMKRYPEGTRPTVRDNI